jgi:hypothetical protein
MAFPLTLWTSDELLATTRKLYWHVSLPTWNARVRSGGFLSRGAQRQHDAREQQVRGIRQLFDVNHLEQCFLPSVSDPP